VIDYSKNITFYVVIFYHFYQNKGIIERDKNYSIATTKIAV
jgi:hypothetical protein